MNQALKKGSTIGIAASSGIFDKKLFNKGLQALHKLGFKTWYREDIFSEYRYFAGSEERRIAELHQLFSLQNVDAIMFARGGYGCQRIIPKLDKKILHHNPKPVIGFSDLTALLSFVQQNFSMPTFYGPLLTHLANSPDNFSAQQLQRAICTPEPLGEMPLDNSKVLKAGSACGKLVGGCLSILNSSLGTIYESNLENCILFIEDVAEDVYAIDRMLTQLKHAKKLATVRGVIFGKTTPSDADKYSLHKMLEDIFADFEIPILVDYPCGHSHPFVTLPLGQTATIELNKHEASSFIITSGSFS